MAIEIRTRRDDWEIITERDCEACGSPVEFSLLVDGGGWGDAIWHVRTVVSHFSRSFATWSEGLTLHGPLRNDDRDGEWTSLRAKMSYSMINVLQRTGCWRG